MGVHSTIEVSRNRARNLISMFSQVASDEDLGRLMDVMLYDRLYNCLIVDGVSDTDELATRCLSDYLELVEESD